MNVFEKVQETRPEIDGADENITAARARLLSEIHAEKRPARSRAARRPWIITAGLVGAAAAVTAGVLVVSQLTAPAPTVEAIPAPTAGPREPGQTIPKPEPTSGTTITEPYPGTTPQAGQYLHVASTTESLYYRDGRVFVWPMHGEFPPISGLLVRGYNETYMPGDRSGEWITRYGPSTERVQFFPEDQGPAGELAWDNQMPVNPEVHEARTMGGLAGDGDTQAGSLASYDEYPRDSQALLDYLLAQVATYSESPQHVDEALLDQILFLLQTNLAPADVRASFLGALALSGLAQIDERSDGTVTYQVRRELFWHYTETITVDSATGWVKEYTLRYDRADGAEGDMVPSDVPDVRTTYRVSIVDTVQ